MRSKTFCMTLMMGLLMFGTSTVVVAQHELMVDVPFNFTVCREQLPAGKYKVRSASSTNPHVVLVQSTDNRSVELACTNDVQGERAATTGKLIFSRYGDQYFLSEIWLQGEKTGRELLKSDKEEALLKEVPARKKREKVTVTIKEAKP